MPARSGTSPSIASCGRATRRTTSRIEDRPRRGPLRARPGRGPRPSGDRDDRLGAPVVRDPPELRDVHQSQTGVDDDRRQGSVGEAGERGPERHDEHQRCPQRADPGSVTLPPTASTIAVRLPELFTGKPCTRPAATLAAPRARSSSRVDAVTVPGGERAGGEHVVGEADDGDRERRGQECPGPQRGSRRRPQRGHVGQAERRQRERQRAHDGHAVVGQPGRPDGQGRSEHADERDRTCGPQPGADQQEHQRAKAHREGRSRAPPTDAGPATTSGPARCRRGCRRRCRGPAGTGP